MYKNIWILVFFVFMTDMAFAQQEWIPVQYNIHPVVYTPVSQPVVQPIYVVQQPAIVYGWVPYQTYRLTVIEQYRLFCKHRTAVYEPSVQWIYQPISKY